MRQNPILRIALVLLGLGLLAALSAPLWLTPLISERVRAAASARSLQASWSELRVTWPATLRARDLVLLRASGDTALVAREFEATSRIWSVLGSGLWSSKCRAVIIIAGVQKPHCRPCSFMKPC